MLFRSKTVEKHRSNLMRKLDLHNASMLTSFAIEKGLLAGDSGAASELRLCHTLAQDGPD